MIRRRPETILIVVATDFSKPARRAFDYAVALARLLHAGICLVHVIKAAWPAGEHGPGSRALRPKKTAALAHLGRLARLASESGVPADTRLAAGSPADLILETCRQRRASLLVAGTHGRDGVRRFVLGSVAEELIRRAACPVLTVKASSPRGLAEGKRETVAD